ncbi:hypothetical protein HN873_007212, partial [Arachis hypogaea]
GIILDPPIHLLLPLLPSPPLFLPIDCSTRIVSIWIKQVAEERRLPKHHIAATSPTVLTYGSYGLRVYNAESNIDALCVAPYFATLLRNFFVVLHDMLKSRSKVSEFYCVKSAKIHLMLFEFGGIFIDLSYACLKLVPNVENFQAMVGVLNYGQKGKEFMAHYMIIWEESILAIIAVYFCQ